MTPDPVDFLSDCTSPYRHVATLENTSRKVFLCFIECSGLSLGCEKPRFMLKPDANLSETEQKRNLAVV